VISFLRRGSGDVEPRLICHVCRRSIALKDAWLAFPPVSHDCPQVPGACVHRDCVAGHTESTFASAHVVLWRAADVFNRLMRA
jgi:hypothetical protein